MDHGEIKVVSSHFINILPGTVKYTSTAVGNTVTVPLKPVQLHHVSDWEVVLSPEGETAPSEG